MTNEMRPCWIDCAPSVGPTTSSWTMRAGAGIRPDLRVLARSFVSSMVKLPEICELPPSISLLTRGAEYTTPSSTMATALPMFALVSCAQRRAPSEFICIETQGCPLLSNSSFASTMTSPSSGARPLLVVTFSAWSSKMFFASMPSAGFALQSRRQFDGTICFASGVLSIELMYAVSRTLA